MSDSGSEYSFGEQTALGAVGHEEDYFDFVLVRLDESGG